MQTVWWDPASIISLTNHLPGLRDRGPHSLPPVITSRHTPHGDERGVAVELQVRLHRPPAVRGAVGARPQLAVQAGLLRLALCGTEERPSASL